MLTKGRFSKLLLRMFSNYTGAKYAFLTTSATTALTMCLRLIDVGASNEVIVSGFSFPASVNVIEDVGATPVFADVARDTFNKTPDTIAALITEQTKAVIFVDGLGNPTGADQITALCHERNIVRLRMRHAQYPRVLPTGELLFNQFDKAQYIHAGAGSSVYDTSVIMGDIQIGENVWIGPYTLIEGINGKVTIGNYVSINAGVMVFAHDSTLHYLSGGKNDVSMGGVTIGSYTVIDSQSMVTCGVSIGSHALVAANSMVNRDVPDNAIVAGNPARLIGTVLIDQDGIASLEYFHNKE